MRRAQPHVAQRAKQCLHDLFFKTLHVKTQVPAARAHVKKNLLLRNVAGEQTLLHALATAALRRR